MSASDPKRSPLRIEEERGQITRQLRNIYTAPSLAAAELEFAEFIEIWEPEFPAMIKAWRDAWPDFVPFLEFPVELRKIVYSTNAIESMKLEPIQIGGSRARSVRGTRRAILSV